MRLDNQVAIVTGAGSGFGAEMARRFAAEGAAVLVADINDNAGQTVAQEIERSGGKAKFCHADVTDRAEVEAMIAAAVETFGRLDILVNNAGYSHVNKPILEVSEDDFDKVYAVNVKAIYLSTLAVVPVFRAQGGGIIINTSSTAGDRPRPGLAWYNSSKGAVNTLTKSLAVEFAADKIRGQRGVSGNGGNRPSGNLHGGARHAGES